MHHAPVTGKQKFFPDRAVRKKLSFDALYFVPTGFFWLQMTPCLPILQTGHFRQKNEDYFWHVIRQVSRRAEVSVCCSAYSFIILPDNRELIAKICIHEDTNS